MKLTSLIITGLFVVTSGAIAGILFAPDNGSKTRSIMARKGKLYKDYLKDRFYDFADSVSHPFEDMEDQATRLSKNALNKAKKIKDEALQRVNADNL